MTKSYCAVSGCASGNRNDRKRRKREGLKNPSLFSVPEDSSIFKKWSAVIPLKNDVLTFQDKICEEHFKESDIVREHVLGFSTLERKKVILKPDAVPSIFESSSKCQTYDKSKVIKPSLKFAEDLNCQKVNLENEEELLVSELDEIEIKRENVKESSVGSKCISGIKKVISNPLSKIIIHTPNYQHSELVKINIPVESIQSVDKIGELVVPDVDKSEIEKKIAEEFPAHLKHFSEKKQDSVKTDAVSSAYRNLLNGQVTDFRKRKQPVECTKSLYLINVNSKNVEEIVAAPGSVDKSDGERKKLDEKGGKNTTYVRKFVLIKPKPVPSLIVNSCNSQDSECKTSQPYAESIQDLIPQKVNLEKIEKCVDDKIDSLHESEPEFSYSFLVENLNAVIKPSDRWGITSHGDFIVYVYWNLKFEAEKKIVFNRDLEIRVFLLDYELQEVYAVRSLADVAKLIWCIDNYTVCAAYRNGFRRDSCQIYMVQNKLEESEIYCKFCAAKQKEQQQLQQRTQQQLERMKQLGKAKESILISKKELYQRITCEKRKHARLIKKVLALKRKLNNQRAFENFCISNGLSDDEC